MKEKSAKLNKRKSEKDESPVKVKKKRESEVYTEVHFKVELKDPNTTFLALEKFIDGASKFLEDGGYDIIAGYCRSSEECTEILQLLEGGKRKPAEVQVIFGALESILIRLVDDLSKHHTVGHNIVKKIWGAHSGSIYYCLSTRNKSSHIKTTLKLLSTMTMLGESSAKAILTQIDFSNPNMQVLYSRRDRKDPQDVRTCLIHFILGFLLTGSDSVIKQLMDTKGRPYSGIKDVVAQLCDVLVEIHMDFPKVLLLPIQGLPLNFSYGLFDGLLYDSIETLQLVLNTLLEKVVQNPVISKTQKVRVFNEQALKHLGNIYHWKGIREWKKSDQREKQDDVVEMEDDSNIEEKQTAAETVHKLLMELCTSYKYGVIFFDKTFGTSQKNQNHILTSFLTSLTRVVETPLMQDLIIASLVACPDQLQYYLPLLHTSLVPRQSTKWISAVDFLIKIYSSQPDSFNINKMKEAIPARKLVTVLQTTIIPPTHILNTIVQGLKHKDLVVRHTVLDFIKLMLRRSAILLKLLSSEEVSDLRSLYRQEEITGVTEQVKEEIFKALPDVSSLLLCWDKLISFMKEKGNKVDNNTESEIGNVPASSHMIRLEQVISLYQGVFPSSLTENPVNINKIMEGVRYLTEQHCQGDKDSASEDETEYLPQLYLLKLLAGADSRKLPWVKESSEGHSLMYLLLEMLEKVKTKPKLVEKTQHLICQLLINTGLFDFNKDELSLWIQHYSRAIAGKGSDDLTQFLSKVFTTLISNPYPFSDKVNEFISEGISLDSTATDMDTHSIGTTDSNIDALLEMEEEDIDDTSEDIKEDDPIVNHLRFPFSPLIVVAFDMLKKTDTSSKDRTTYMSGLVLDLLHCQLNPFPLISLLQSYLDINIDKSVRSYIMYFLHSQKKQKTPDITPITGEVSVTLMNVFLTGTVSDQRELLASLSSVPRHSIPMLTRQCLLYINHMLKSTEQGKEVNKRMLSFFQCIEELMKTVLEKADENVRNDEQSSSQEGEFQELELKQKTQEEVIEDVTLTVLKHPAILKWFLFVQNASKVNLTTENPDFNINLRSVFITECICNLICLLKNVNFRNLGPCFDEYVCKIEQLLCNIDRVENKRLVTVVSQVQNILSIITKSLPVERISNLIEIILKVPKNLLISGGKLSNLSAVAIELLSKLLNDSNDQLLKMDSKCIKCLFHLLLDTSDSDVIACCDNLLQSQTHLSSALDSEILDSLMISDEEKITKMVESIVLHNNVCADHFRQQFMKGSFDKKLEKITPGVLILTRKIGPATDKPSNSKWLKSVCKKYRSLMDNVCSVDPGENLVQLIISLVKVGMLEKQKVFLIYMKSATQHSLQNLHQVNLLYFLSDESLDQQKTLLNLFIRSLIELQSGKENKDLLDGLVEKILALLQNVASDIDVESKTLQKFIKVILKSRFTDRRTFQIISHLVQHMSDLHEVIPVTTLYQMIMSHSLFLPAMFDEKCQDVKGELCNLLLCCVESDSNCCSTQHYAIFLGSYMATLCDTDQKLLKIMYICEKNECNITEYRPYLWGPKAVEHHSVQKTIGPSLLKKASVDQVIENLDQSKLYTSVLNFPLRRKLQAFTIQDCEDCKSTPDVYDPCFLLPLFSNILSPDQLIDCRKFIERGCLGYMIAALSCHDNTMRGAAYFVLNNFLHQLEGSRFQEKEQILYVTRLIRNSIEKPNTKLPCIITVFLAKIVKLMLKAEQHMYQMMNTFLYLKPTLDVTNVPEFYKLFNSSTLEYREERGWILNLLLDGMRETADYRIFEKRYTFKLLLSFFDTAISDKASQVTVLKIINSACLERTVAMDLTRNHGIVTWLTNIISSSENIRHEILTDIVHDLWITMVGKKQQTSDGKGKFLPPAFSREMMAACKELLKRLGEEVSIATVIKLFETMSSILQHLLFTCEQLEGQGHLYTPSILTLQDMEELLRLTKHFSKHKIISYENERSVDDKEVKDAMSSRSDIPESMSEAKMSSRSDIPGSMSEAKTKEQSIQISSHEKLVSLAMKLFVHWKPFNVELADTQTFLVITMPSQDYYTTFLETCMWMMQEIKSCNELDLMDQTLQWMLKHLKSLTDTDQSRVYFLKSHQAQLMDNFVHLYSVINNKYKTSNISGMEKTLENLVACVNNLLICVVKTDEAKTDRSLLLHRLESKDLSSDGVSLLMKTHLL